MKRFLQVTVMNLIVPGTGLMMLGRGWLGLALAVWFALAAEVAIAGLLIAPAVVERWAALAVGGFALAAWFVAQGLLISRIRFLLDPALPRELAILRRLARGCLAHGKWKAARSALLLAMSVDDGDAETRLLWARLVSETAGGRRAWAAWRAAAQYDREHRFSAEITAALERFAPT
ncbi:MAG TPA: hypothetical protein PKY77_08670 [Phycisphaerae bacterium]|nr:hypothetical protein [Phycisphaerae bacterium]HRY67247.1 hypothetical protein [Phycisphaerae bacterium]HSA26383.1 hypothetical protein [Phycisphaerae bacterium]